jgi:hypothetical protein
MTQYGGGADYGGEVDFAPKGDVDLFELPLELDVPKSSQGEWAAIVLSAGRRLRSFSFLVSDHQLSAALRWPDDRADLLQ